MLIIETEADQIHFNIPKLESVIIYCADDKDSTGIWNAFNAMDNFGEELFSLKLEQFLEINKIKLAELNS